MDQLSLFDDDAAERHAPSTSEPDPLALEHARARPLATALPASLRFGTSSWSFPGWRGLVFGRDVAAAALARDGLRDYARHPLLRTVGVDRTYYAPISDAELRHYADQLPDWFRACFKAPAAVTSAFLPFGGPAEGVARPNPDFLSVERLEVDLLAPLDRAFARHTDLILLEFPPTPPALRIETAEFLERLDAFLTRLPHGFHYTVEIREARLLTAAYRALLQRHAVGHVYNYWARMPMPLDQARVVPIDGSAPACVRLLMRPGTTYEAQRERFRPFNRLVEPDERMRRDVVSLVRDATGAGVPLAVLVNNKAEGSAPLTIRALAEAIARALAPQE